MERKPWVLHGRNLLLQWAAPEWSPMSGLNLSHYGTAIVIPAQLHPKALQGGALEVLYINNPYLLMIWVWTMSLSNNKTTNLHIKNTAKQMYPRALGVGTSKCSAVLAWSLTMKSWAFWWRLHQNVYSNTSVTCCVKNAACMYAARRLWSNSLKWVGFVWNIHGCGKKIVSYDSQGLAPEM